MTSISIKNQSHINTIANIFLSLLESGSKPERIEDEIQKYLKQHDKSATSVHYLLEKKTEDPIFICLLGFFYEVGIGHADKYKALQTYKVAAQKKDTFGEWLLARCYFWGIGTPIDLKEAFRWYLSSAKRGNILAQYSVIWFYQFGVEVPMNRELAYRWARCAAERGLPKAQWRLGYFYENAIGIEKNVQEALSWYSKSAENGDLNGEYHMGRCFENGLGTMVDIEKAKHWYRLSAKHGNEEARYKLMWLENRNFVSKVLGGE